MTKRSRSVGAAKPPTDQINCRLPVATLEYLDWLERRKGTAKARYLLAALVSYECLDEEARSAFMEWATRISRGEASWGEIPGVEQHYKKKDLDPKRVLASLEQLFGIASAKIAGHRGAANR